VAECRLSVRVTPRARADEIVGVSDGVVVVRVKAPPEDGRANAALCRLLAKRLGLRIVDVSVVRGTRSRVKTVKLDGLDRREAERALAGD
jgi:uncharacterized protein (TIGR00251 family)